MSQESRARIGYACAYAPLPLMAAAGLEPYRILPLGGAPDAAGERLHDNLCPHIKRVLDRALCEDLPELTGVLFVNSCDAMRRLADAWPTARPADRVALVDLPVHAGPGATAYLADELARLAEELGTWTGRPVTGRAVIEATGRYDALAEGLAALEARLRPVAGGAAAWQAEALAAVTLPLDEALARVRAGLADPVEGEPARGPAVLLFGNVLPDPAAFELFAQAGVRVVADDQCTGGRQLSSYGLDDPERAIEQLAAALLARPACARTFDPDRPGVLADRVLERARAAGAAGVVAHVMKFCDPYLSRLPAVRERLREEGLPLLVLEGDCSLRSLGQQRTRLEAFAEMIGQDDTRVAP